MEKSVYESMSGDSKDKTKVQSWEEIVQAIRNDMNTHPSEDKLVSLEDLVRDYKKVKSSPKHRQNQRKVPPPIFSRDWREHDEESKNLPVRILQLTERIAWDSPLQRCLLSFAIFPENSIIKKRSLIYWWIGQELIFQKEDRTAEQEGEDIYNELLKQGLIEPDDNDPSPLMNRCKMHPLIRYMLILKAKEEGLFYFKLEDNNTPKDLRNCSLSSSHLRLRVGGLIFGGEDGPQEKLAKDEEVSTAFNVNQQYLNLPHHWLSNMRNLKVLQLGRWQHSPMHHIEVDDQKFLDELGVHHKHLKFLSLRGISRITSLPDSIVQLVNLEILDLRACHNLEKLPEDIASLKKLTHLDVSECYLIERMPKGTEKLSSLQVLKGFVIGTARKNPCKISDLKKLKKLRRLSIYIGRGAAIGGEEFASLKDVASLCSLTISWGVTSLASQSSLPKDQFLPKKLEKLELIGMPVASIPKWLNPQELENLKKLYIIGGELANWDRQQQNEQWSVEILRLKHLRKLRIGNNEDVLKKFPRLGYFEKINCADDDVLWYKSRE
ncbi:disease resistance RPP13-like protein 4 [Eucalyptus grandis]|uniref:disease resistance RPP13-like protein 4 n=1 Tax=Eucalyptus grandis TaxID=71139 RepID=UPI00192F094B|nr:disease resistance RPP13-like protein 4 [Eucalyptus grandis]